MLRTPLARLLFALVVLSFLAAGLPPAAMGAPDACSGLFFSEYIEGSSNNKALEIFNGTAAAVDLSAYKVELYSNGSATANNTANLSGTLASGDVYVIANAAANATILAVADLTSTVTYFNGDDAVVLKYNDVIIDVVGQVGYDPGTKWGTEPNTTVEHTLRRKISISTGDANGSDAFDPATEWDSYDQDTADGLGTHTATCYTPSDVAPTVSSTTPANNATGVAVNATITVNFSESVDVAAGAFSLACPAGTAKTFTTAPVLPATGTTSVVLTPDNDLPQNTVCTVTVDKSKVTDKDSTTDNMAENYSWSFTTAAEIVAELIINEVDSDTPGTDTAEFIELYDGGVGNTSLDGFVVVLYNGSNDLSYGAYDLDGYTTDASGYFVLGNAAVPGVGLTFADNLIQNGADAVAFYLGDAASFPNGTSVTTANLVDAIVYDTSDADDTGLLVLLNAGQPQVDENDGGKGANYANQRCPNGAGGALNTNTYDQFPPTPGEANLCPDFIHEIQGSGSAGNPGTYTVEAIVIGDYQGVTGTDDYKLDGFFIQEEDTDADTNAATSEGIFVFCSTCPTNVVVGDKVQVTGATSEYYNMSQLSATTAGSVVVVSSGNALPTPAALTLPVPGVTAADLAGATAQINAYYEPFEGMLVKFPAQLSVTEYFELSRYGQVVLAQGGRFRQFTDVSAPATAGYTAHQIDLAKRTVILDDDSNQQNHALFENVAVFHLVPGFSTTNYLRGGDTIADLTGVLHWSFAGLTGTDAWRIRPVMNASNAPVYPYTFTSGNPRGGVADVGGNLKVASFNVLNYFTTLGSRGANSTAELDRQAAKIIAAFAGLDADVIGVMEIENNNDGAIADLVSRLNASAGAGTYAYIATGTVGTDAITVGIIYKPAKVTPVGAVQTLTAAAFTDPNDTGTQRNRPAVAQTFEENIWGERFTVVVNHLKSKGCGTPAPTGADADQLDGQSCWNDTRQKAAAYMVGTWIPALAASSGDTDFLIIGDLNSYRKEAPITNIKNAGYADLLDTWLGAPAYGYVFDGQLGYLDHALSSATLTPQVSGATEWHINSDEANLLDYNDTVRDTGEANYDPKPSALPLYEANAYRSSDHDPVLVGLNLLPNQSNLTGYDGAWHTGASATILGNQREREDGTADNDGVVPTPGVNWQAGAGGGSIDVTVTGATGYFSAWIDWNADNDFADTGEFVINNRELAAGTHTRTFDIPAGVTFPKAFNARFRLYASSQNATLLAAGFAPDAAPSPSGGAAGGEVEDYAWNFGPNAVGLRSLTAAPLAPAAWPLWAGLVGLAGLATLRRRR